MQRAARTWGLWLCLALGVALAAWAVRVRDPAPADAPSTDFSAARAMADVRRVGAEPHPIGSAADDRVRAALLPRMAALGLDPQVREGVGLDLSKWAPHRLAAGEVRNLEGVIPGRDRTAPALLLMAHYDSVPNSPGAADDGAGVAAALEIARLLKATGPHARDVIVLLTDGEESGLLGAEAFFREDPWARRVGAVVNLEARGDAGRTAMFETGPGNAETIRLYAAAAQAPFANSLTGFLYHQLPNDTDFTQAYRRRLPGLNFAFTGDQLAYHTPLATPDHLSQQSLQHMGDQAAPAALALADAPRLPARTADLAYFDVLAVALVAYPPGWGWVVTLAGALLLGAAFVGARRWDGDQPRPTLGGVARGAAAAFTAALAAALVTHVAGRWLDGGGYVAGYGLYRAVGLLFAGVVLLVLGAALGVTAVSARGLGAGRLMAATLAAALLSLPRGPDLVTGGLALATLAGLFILRRRPLDLWSAWLGAAVALGVLALVLQATAPLAAPLAQWPFLIGAAAATWCAWAPRRARAAAFLAAGAAAVLLTAQLGALANGLFTAIGRSTPEVAAPFVLLLLPVLLPFAHAAAARRRTRFAAGAAVLLGAGVTAAAASGPPTPARPALTEALYVVDASGAQRRVAPLPRLDAWSRTVLAPPSGRPGRETLEPLFAHAVWTAPATAVAPPPPRLTLTRQDGRMRLLAVPAGGGRSLRLFLRSPGGLEDVRVQGRPSRMRGAPGRWALVSFDAPPPQGVTVDLAAGALEVQAFEQRDGWPPGAPARAKPPQLMAFGDSDTTLVGARAAIP